MAQMIKSIFRDVFIRKLSGRSIFGGDEAFSPGDVANAELSTVYTSSRFFPRNIPVDTAITIADGTYQKNGSGGFVSGATTYAAKDYFEMRGTSSGEYETAVSPTMTFGAVEFVYQITTKAA